MNFFSYFFPKILAKYSSKFNGEIKVMEFFGKKYLEVANLEQSGPMMEKMYRKMFIRYLTHRIIKNAKEVLLMGVGGGTLVKLLNSINPDIKITGIEIDRQMVKAGEDYLDFDVSEINIIYGNAFQEISKLQQKYDLIIIDLFCGRLIPEELQNEKFLQQLKSHLTKNGCVIFNRLYFQRYKNEAENFLDKVKEIFQDVTKEKIFYNLFIKAK